MIPTLAIVFSLLVVGGTIALVVIAAASASAAGAIDTDEQMGSWTYDVYPDDEIVTGEKQ